MTGRSRLGRRIPFAGRCGAVLLCLLYLTACQAPAADSPPDAGPPPPRAVSPPPVMPFHEERAPDYLGFIESEYRRLLAAAPREEGELRRRMIELLRLHDWLAERAALPLRFTELDGSTGRPRQVLLADDRLPPTTIWIAAPKATNGAVALLAHGHGENGRTILESPLAAALLRQGFTLYAPTLPVSSPEQGLGFEAVCPRLWLLGRTLTGLRIYLLVRTLDLAIYRERPTAVFAAGHSLGALLAQDLAVIDSRVGAVLADLRHRYAEMMFRHPVQFREYVFNWISLGEWETEAWLPAARPRLLFDYGYPGEQAEQAATALNERLGRPQPPIPVFAGEVRSAPAPTLPASPVDYRDALREAVAAAPARCRTLAATEQQELLAAIGLRDMEEILTRLHWREKATTADGARRMTTLEARSDDKLWFAARLYWPLRDAGPCPVLIVDGNSLARSGSDVQALHPEACVAVLHLVENDTEPPARPLRFIGRTRAGMETLQLLSLVRYLRRRSDVDAGRLALSPLIRQDAAARPGATWWAAFAVMLDANLGHEIFLRPTPPEDFLSGELVMPAPDLALAGFGCDLVPAPDQNSMYR